MSICISAASLSPRESFYDNGPSARRMDLSIAIGTKPLVAGTWKKRQRKIYPYIVGSILTMDSYSRKKLLYRIEKYASTRCFFVSKERLYDLLYLSFYLYLVFCVV